MQVIAIPILTFIVVMSLGGAVVTAIAARRQRVRERLATEPAGGAESYDGAPLTRLARRVGEKFDQAEHTPGIRQRLAMAGYHGATAATTFVGAKIISLCCGLIGLGAGVSMLAIPLTWKIAIVCFGSGLLFMVPNLIVAIRRSHRVTEVRQHLPDAIDLLEVCVTAGMGLDMAWNAVAEQVKRVSGVLSDEMVLTNLELHLGAPRHEAMRNMAHRTGSDDLASLVSVLIQTERFGTNVAEALRSFATSMRDNRRQRAEEEAEKIAVKLLFPMIVLIFPALFVVVGGPAALRIYDMMIQMP